MTTKMPPVWICALLLAAALFWRMIGAPVTSEQFGDLKTQMWQMQIQLPSRMGRMLRLWQPPMEKQTDKVCFQTPQSEEEPKDEIMVQVYLTEEDKNVLMTLESYVCGVVAAEMPAKYHMEALKAQAVAARTRAVRQMESGGCSRHDGADICDDSAHCQAFAKPADCEALWKDSFAAYRDRILQAQQETRGQIITYGGEPITVLYHAISGGRTEDASAVFSQSLPYLVSVESQGEEETRGFWQETHMSYEEIAQKLSAAAGQTFSAQEVRRSLTIAGHTDSGRVRSVLIGSQTMDASDFRKALGLRSTWFSLSSDEEGITFHQRGYGHGVGMSQAGANGMAASGTGYAVILQHYYPGTSLMQL